MVEGHVFLPRICLAPSTVEAALANKGRTTTVTGNGCNSIMLSAGLRCRSSWQDKMTTPTKNKLFGPDVGVDRPNGIAPARWTRPHVVGTALAVARLSDTLLGFHIAQKPV